MKALIAVLAAVFATTYTPAAHADNAAYNQAETLYNSAAPSTLAEVVANPWMLVGKASAPSKDQSTDGVWADGRMPGRHNDGYYQEYLTFSNAVDADGNVEQTAMETYYGAESGKLYYSIDYTYSVDPEGVNYIETSASPKSLYTCRTVLVSGSLLCKVTFNKPRNEARNGLTRGQAVMYLTYTAVAPAVQ